MLQLSFIWYCGAETSSPPGYSSVIFPAAGLAFIVVLTGGIRFLPVIWLGSFLLNVWMAFPSSTLDLTTLGVAVLLGIGASLQAWATAYLIETYTIEISGSCGVTLYPTDNEDLDILLRHADHAMYEAKASGKNQFKIFNSQNKRSKI